MRKIVFFSMLCAAGCAAAAAIPNGGNLRLGELDQLLSERNRTLVAARRATSSAEANKEVAGARPNPTLSFNAGSINPHRSPSSGNMDSVLRIDQPIERGNKRELRLAVASLVAEAAQLDESDTLRLQRLAAAQAYFDLKAAQEKARIGTESAQLARQILSRADLRLKAGDLSPAEVARIRADTVKAESDATQAQIDLQRARLALAQLLAAEADAERLTAADPWPALQPLNIAEFPLNQRPDVAAAQRRLDSAEKAIELAKAQRIRDVTIGAQVERDNQDRAATTVGFGISIPLFTGYDYRGEIRQSYIARDSARDELERIRATAQAEFRQARYETDALSERAGRLLNEALPSARKALNAVQLAFSQGAVSALDVIDARRSLQLVEIDTINALADAAKARAAWAAALNSPTLP